MNEWDSWTTGLRSISADRLLSGLIGGEGTAAPDRDCGPVLEPDFDLDEAARLSAEFAVPATTSRPPLPPLPTAAAQERSIPPLPQKPKLRLSRPVPIES